ncbi:ATP-dependent Clp protease proteolytic subunit [Cyanidioschyzon merolae strain 10D]|jgi:ATP-dependent Clp protease protease subunit|uniref:ATP-dependent Clp protease proteolytic subunit n=1 Tax=Cyanidioschyzon merolae (strain NIES-3377 / 10D) TaxID=280699 RepID=M1V833_CYAM1|nr:ATP-dependent Clp protease proteolytic subunit [Cyanidioschyzon merolae strain 10D]BAM80269.1 ATP-dependent Clp protease proteolytic subunit [Cyanidioschyzon merolae strain 10D]|eukprot:XP_005534876.1 ATP-dependent Clp protease proteolytic subunit [Cyanidioschyzon merolae strain 10D]
MFVSSLASSSPGAAQTRRTLVRRVAGIDSGAGRGVRSRGARAGEGFLHKLVYLRGQGVYRAGNTCSGRRRCQRNACQLVQMSRTMPRVPYRGPGMQEYVFIDLMQRLNKDRIIFLGEEIDEEVANQTVALLLQMKEEDSVSPVRLYCQIPGGIYTAGMMIYDCVKNLPFDVITLNMGMAAGMGAFLVAGGTKGKRFALPNARFLFQQPSLLDDVEGSAEDIKTEVLNVLRQRDQWLHHLSEFTGHPVEKIKEDFRRDRYFTAAEAREYGLIDRVLEPTMKGITKDMEAQL